MSSFAFEFPLRMIEEERCAVGREPWMTVAALAPNQSGWRENVKAIMRLLAWRKSHCVMHPRMTNFNLLTGSSCRGHNLQVKLINTVLFNNQSQGPNSQNTLYEQSSNQQY